MFFPIRTDRVQRHTPWLNYALIAANVVVFLITRDQLNTLQVRQWFLSPQQPQWWQFLSYQFLHANFMHLGGNMLFLYVFGNSIEDRLGKLGYLFFYLAGGVFAGIGHVLGSAAPVLGASGSVSAVTGAYLALFPMTYVTIVYFFIFVGAFEVASMWLILLRVAQDFVFHVGNLGGNVAYGAHLAGYLYGFVVGMALLGVRLLPREPYDLLSMLEHRRRRSQFRRAADKGYRPWEFHKPGDPPPAAGDGPKPLTPEEQRITDLRSRISAAVRDHDLPTAVDLYAQLLKIDPKQVLGQQQQLDLANQLMSAQQYAEAAAAYERFLNTYTSYSQREQVQLILALIYVRYLERRQRARELLDAALPRLHEGEQKSLAQEIMDELGPRV
jgi:membrane associated rhomboid family serine protease